jgi:hypothetical protein
MVLNSYDYGKYLLGQGAIFILSVLLNDAYNLIENKEIEEFEPNLIICRLEIEELLYNLVLRNPFNYEFPDWPHFIVETPSSLLAKYY